MMINQKNNSFMVDNNQKFFNVMMIIEADNKNIKNKVAKIDEFVRRGFNYYNYIIEFYDQRMIDLMNDNIITTSCVDYINTFNNDDERSLVYFIVKINKSKLPVYTLTNQDYNDIELVIKTLSDQESLLRSIIKKIEEILVIFLNNINCYYYHLNYFILNNNGKDNNQSKQSSLPNYRFALIPYQDGLKRKMYFDNEQLLSNIINKVVIDLNKDLNNNNKSKYLITLDEINVSNEWLQSITKKGLLYNLTVDIKDETKSFIDLITLQREIIQLLIKRIKDDEQYQNLSKSFNNTFFYYIANKLNTTDIINKALIYYLSKNQDI